MPELPEVETICRQLSQKIVGKKLNGQEIIAVRRRAKMPIIDFVDGSSLVFHLKLTGQLLFNGKPSRHTRKVFNFSDGSCLIFNDMIKFGWWKIVDSTEALEAVLGPEPLPLTLKQFKELLAKRPRSKIKPLLMDQKFIAGIGNIYADEILFASKVQPTRVVSSLQPSEVASIFQNIKKILKAAINAGGSTIRDYLDVLGKKGDYAKHHKVYRKTGQACSRCGAEIKRIKLGGRGTHYCPNCQK